MIIQAEPIDFPSLSGMMRGKVIRNDDPLKEGRIGVVIPKLMPSFDTVTEEPDETSFDRTVAATFEINSESRPDGNVYHNNYYWIRPTNDIYNGLTESTIGGKYKTPRIGTWVYIFFEDEDIQKGYYAPWTPTIKGNVVSHKNLLDSAATVDDPVKKPNIDIIREYSNGTIIAVDINEEVNNFLIAFDNGHQLRIIDDGEGKNRMEMITGHTNYITIDDTVDDITVFAHRDVNVIAERDINGTAERDINLTANTNNVNIEAAKTVNVKATDVNVDASNTINLKGGSKIGLEAPLITLKGTVKNN